MRFTFRPALTIAALIGLAILLALGTWQVQRLAWKEDLITRIEARTSAVPIPFVEAYERWLAGEDMEYTPVTLTVNYDSAREAHVFGTWEGDIGWYVFTPVTITDEQALDLPGDRTVYVNRGFVPDALKASDSRPDLQSGADPAAGVRVTGLFRQPQSLPAIARSLKPANNPATNEWHERDPQAFAAASGTEALPVWIDSFGAESPGDWPRGGTTRVTFNNRHLEYALTWFGLAATLIAVFLAFSLRREGESR